MKEQDLLNEIKDLDLKLKDSRSAINHLRLELLNAETILIGDKIRREKLLEELRKLQANREDV